MTSDKSRNPFFEEDEVDDSFFLTHPKQGQDGYMLQTDNDEERQSSFASRQQQLSEECRLIEERTLKSSVNSLGLLHESEQVGIMTAEELVNQREQLQNVEQNLDHINSTMRISQKHINSMKSMFGGIKNYFSGNKTSAMAPSSTQVPISKPVTSGLQERLGSLKVTEKSMDGGYPALKIRPTDAANPFSASDDEDDFEHLDLKPGISQNVVGSPTSPVTGYSQNVDAQLDQNLEFMSMGLGRLKNLAIGLNQEIETQNDMLDRINIKSDRADESLEHQNRQIKRILKD